MRGADSRRIALAGSSMTRAGAQRPALRTVFISDVHLGYRGCQAERLLEFLAALDTERLVLLGDIIDVQSLRRSFYWPAAHQAVLRRIVALARAGTRVVYVPGNHDEDLREFCGADFMGVEVVRDFIHETADGRRLLVVHGDEFDGAVKFSGALKHFGEWMYDGMLWLGAGVQRVRRRLGLGHWSLATWVKQRVPDARRYIERFEQAAAHAARRHGLDGIVCGHIHLPALREVDGIQYCNDGDWVEHGSALAEGIDGRLFLVGLDDLPGRAGVPAAPVALPTAA